MQLPRHVRPQVQLGDEGIRHGRCVRLVGGWATESRGQVRSQTESGNEGRAVKLP